MARNQNVAKLKRQQFQRRRGRFSSGSDASTLDKGYAKSENKMKAYWGEAIKVRPRGGGQSGVSRAEIPQNQLGYFDYRGRAKGLSKTDESSSTHLTPATIFWLTIIHPGTTFVSKERQAALKALSDLMADNLTDPSYYIRPLPVSDNWDLRLYWTAGKSCWWWYERKFNTYRVSFTYGNKERALLAAKNQTISWKKPVLYEPVPRP